MDVKCAYDKIVPISQIIPNPRNPNRHPPSQIGLLARIIDVQGWRAPITISNRSGLIVRGHARLLAAQLLELEECPVDYQDYNSDEEELADLVADNRLTELANIDDSLLAEIMASIEEGGVDMDLTGYDGVARARMAEDALADMPVDLDELLSDLDFSSAVDAPTWVVARTEADNRPILEEAASWLRARGIRVEIGGHE